MIEHFSLGKALECDNCLKVGNIVNTSCFNETCGVGLDRCSAMTYTAVLPGGHKHQGWVKMCHNSVVCGLDAVTICNMARQYNSTTMQALQGLENCNLVCSVTRDVQIPAYLGSTAAPGTTAPSGDATALSASVVTAFLAFVAAVSYFTL